ncbi:SAM-dependent methyltransferase [Flectobacillus rivi]|uniref:Class I SAM-dependent methyltransferase n=1 Tax=Flectobacillus rivi TaxID=2984209 RepID=A0ABT6Z079_9BACT|nr:class I SAM-dependent methyltransferase [Flectobacillus rivi]MDI9874536.1 class I SAM-dependent methyltransferase [Flectobacillus rivi]
MMTKEWFSSWFDSPYYHILYKERDDKEAQLFMDQLSSYLQIQPEHHIMDLACGKGRHAIYLNQKGFEVTGVDLSPQSIAFAKIYENAHLHFFVHDMREVFEERYFDFILNMFTSFGYLENHDENIKAFQAAARNLRKGGIFVMDFFNTEYVKKQLLPFQVKEIDGIRFEITKTLQDGFIIKDIDFMDEGHEYHFHEKVQAISLTDFQHYFSAAGLKLKQIFGDYHLNAFDIETSPRMIFILEK